MVILAIDPGSKKCGIAVVDSAGSVLRRQVIAVENLPLMVREFAELYHLDTVVIGGSTGSQHAAAVVHEVLGLEVHFVDEKYSSERAKARYFRENPPQGWKRLLPLGLLYPPEPFDDYAAIILAEKFIKEQVSELSCKR